MRVEAQLPRPAIVKAPAARVAKRQEAPRVARQLRQRASPLESRDSPLKSMCQLISPCCLFLTSRSLIKAPRHIVPARTDRSRAVPSEKPKIEPAGRWLTPRPTDFRDSLSLSHLIGDC